MVKPEMSWSSGMFVDPRRLYEWCRIPAGDLPGHPGLRVAFRQVENTDELGALIARELTDLIEENNARGADTRAIIPCGPRFWCEPFAQRVNARKISLKRFFVFHMDECLDWQGRLLPKNHPYNFRSFMERHFYGPVNAELAVPEAQRFWLTPSTMEAVGSALAKAPIDLTVGGWGLDGHIAYNQPGRHPLHHLTLQDVRESSIRIQENNVDTILAAAQRTFGTAYQFVPPMSVTLGMSECLSAKKIRVYSDTGAWKQTALRVALFSEPVAEYPMSLLQEHPDACITATRETAAHPIAENPDWELF